MTTLRLIDINELREIMGVSVSTIERLIKSGNLPQPIRLGNKLRRWNIRDIEKALGLKSGEMDDTVKP